MVEDPFYALHDVFELSACSEKQFLNMLDSKLSIRIGDTHNGKHDGLSDLSTIKEILYQHLNSNRRIVDFVKQALQHRKWPRAQEERIRQANNTIKEMFEDLCRHAEIMYERCQGGITVLMNSMTIVEAERSIQQAEKISKLTFLAFIFVPLSFTTSFFGMNVIELGSSQGLSIWVWFTVSGSLTTITMVSFYMDFEPLRRRLLKAWQYFRDMFRLH